jgi:hypothetical protein
MQLGHGINDRRRSHCISQPPAGHDLMFWKLATITKCCSASITEPAECFSGLNGCCLPAGIARKCFFGLNAVAGARRSGPEARQEVSPPLEPSARGPQHARFLSSTETSFTFCAETSFTVFVWRSRVEKGTVTMLPLLIARLFWHDWLGWRSASGLCWRATHPGITSRRLIEAMGWGSGSSCSPLHRKISPCREKLKRWHQPGVPGTRGCQHYASGFVL